MSQNQRRETAGGSPFFYVLSDLDIRLFPFATIAIHWVVN